LLFKSFFSTINCNRDKISKFFSILIVLFSFCSIVAFAIKPYFIDPGYNFALLLLHLFCESEVFLENKIDGLLFDTPFWGPLYILSAFLEGYVISAMCFQFLVVFYFFLFFLVAPAISLKFLYGTLWYWEELDLSLYTTDEINEVAENFSKLATPINPFIGLFNIIYSFFKNPSKICFFLLSSLWFFFYSNLFPFFKGANKKPIVPNGIPQIVDNFLGLLVFLKRFFIFLVCLIKFIFKLGVIFHVWFYRNFILVLNRVIDFFLFLSQGDFKSILILFFSFVRFCSSHFRFFSLLFDFLYSVQSSLGFLSYLTAYRELRVLLFLGILYFISLSWYCINLLIIYISYDFVFYFFSILFVAYVIRCILKFWYK